MTEKEWNRGDRATYARMISRLDSGVAAIAAALREKDLEQSTLVMFASDNGATSPGSNTPFSGKKSTLYEGGIRVPCVIRWPGKLAAGQTVDDPVMTMDLTVSVVRSAGQRAPADRPFDGIDVVDFLRDGKPLPSRPLFWRSRRGERTWRAVRDGEWKYLACEDQSDRKAYLFNLEHDPAEKANLLTAEPDQVRRLQRLLTDWENEVQAPRP